jgi:ribulose-bisphosphate carboxylase small chain
MWDAPQFDLHEEDADMALREVLAAREAHPASYVKVVCYDRALGRQSSRLSLIVGRPVVEPGFRVERQEGPDRRIRYTITRA